MYGERDTKENDETQEERGNECHDITRVTKHVYIFIRVVLIFAWRKIMTNPVYMSREYFGKYTLCKNETRLAYVGINASQEIEEI